MSNATEISELRILVEQQQREIEAIKATMLNTCDGLSFLLQAAGVISRDKIAAMWSANTAERRLAAAADDLALNAELDMIDHAARRLLAAPNAVIRSNDGNTVQ